MRGIETVQVEVETDRHSLFDARGRSDGTVLRNNRPAERRREIKYTGSTTTTC